MKIPQHIIDHGFEYLLSGLAVVSYIAFMAVMDARHLMRSEAEADERVQQIEWYDEKIEDIDDDTNRMRLYNQLGSKTNAPARNQIIIQNNAKRARLVSKKDAYIAEGQHD